MIPSASSAVHSRPLAGSQEPPTSISAFAVFLAVLLVSCPAQAIVVGVDFVETPLYSPLLTMVPIDNLVPFEFTAPGNRFGENGALDGSSEADVRTSIVQAIQQIFRRAEIDMPGRMLHVDIRQGPVDPGLGTVHLIGESIFDPGFFGVAYPTGATTRPDLQAGSVYTNELSLTLANIVNQIPDFSPGIEFQTLAEVVQSIAGTAAHEIAHTLNVWNHVPGEPVQGTFPIMASGETSLPLAERLQERRFLNLPNTQYSVPQPPPGGTLSWSVTDTLLDSSGTTSVADFNFDGTVDVADFNVWNQHKFQAGTGVKSGDANDDGITDVADFNLWNSVRFMSTADPARGPLLLVETGGEGSVRPDDEPNFMLAIDDVLMSLSTPENEGFRRAADAWRRRETSSALLVPEPALTGLSLAWMCLAIVGGQRACRRSRSTCASRLKTKGYHVERDLGKNISGAGFPANSGKTQPTTCIAGRP